MFSLPYSSAHSLLLNSHHGSNLSSARPQRHKRSFRLSVVSPASTVSMKEVYDPISRGTFISLVSVSYILLVLKVTVSFFKVNKSHGSQKCLICYPGGKVHCYCWIIWIRKIDYYPLTRTILRPCRGIHHHQRTRFEDPQCPPSPFLHQIS